MDECSYCGAELIGAKRFCVKCGREQKDRPKKTERDEKPAPAKHEEQKADQCYRCGEDTERICYFCGKPICQQHTLKMQANTLPSVEFRTAMDLGDRKRINNNWRGMIIPVCMRCQSMNEGRQLSEDEKIEIRTVDTCSWFELKPKLSKY